jgi:hypothetical protein
LLRRPHLSLPPWHRHPADVRSDRLNADRIDDSRPTTSDTECARDPSPSETSNLEPEIAPPDPSSPNLSTFQSALSYCASADPAALTSADLAPVIAGLRTAFAELARGP